MSFAHEVLVSTNFSLSLVSFLTTALTFKTSSEQNPVEDMWLQGKRFLREHWYLCKSFSLIKKLFMLVTHFHTLDFSKLNMYGFFPKNSELIPS